MRFRPVSGQRHSFQTSGVRSKFPRGQV